MFSILPQQQLHLSSTSHFRWNFVIDGAIDEYSRLALYLIVNTDNLAAGAFQHFLQGVREYGIPSHIRADKGGEFVHIKYFTDEFYGGDQRKSLMKGCSFHNQRIEPHWRDVYCKGLDKYHRIFYSMERMGILDVNKAIHQFYILFLVPEFKKILINGD